MTDAELAACKARAQELDDLRKAGRLNYGVIAAALRESQADVPALVAEVERLRGRESEAAGIITRLRQVMPPSLAPPYAPDWQAMIDAEARAWLARVADQESPTP